MTLSQMIKLARPHFLLGGVFLYALGAVSTGIDSIGSLLLGQIAITASQLTAHFVNEYADAEVDAHVVNRTWFSGGSGVLADGDVDRRIAVRAAVAATAVSVTAAGLLAPTRPLAALIAASTLLISWGYSMPPIRILDSGWGEAATTLVTTVAVPFTGAFAQAGSISAELGWAMAALFAFHMAMITTFEIPDLESDARAGKTVLAVRVGLVWTRRLIAGFITAGFGLVVMAGFVESRDLLWMLVGVPAAVVLIASIHGRNYARMTTAAIATIGATATGAMIALVVR